MQSNSIIVLAGMFLLSMLPFLFIIVTSYVKIVVVLSLLRNALGIQQIPPNLAINALAITLSLFIMAPVGYDMYYAGVDTGIDIENPLNPRNLDAVKSAAAPLEGFLTTHSDDTQRQFFVRSAEKLWPDKYAADISETNFLVLMPSFLTSELKSAFEIGFLLFLPFIAIDLIVSNILLAMGMMMVSPMTISLPFKLLLFVLVDGWSRLLHGLILGYA